MRRLSWVLGAIFTLSACEGDNLFVSPELTGGGGGSSARVPEVVITTPTGDSTSAKPIGDSVRVSARIEARAGLKSVQFEGLSFRGDPDLGTEEIVERFQTKIVELLAPVKDTTLARFLIPTPDSTRETTNLIVTATDTLGQSSADTVRLILGGPDVQLLNLVGGETIQSGRTLAVRVLAKDPGGVRSVEIIVTGALSSDQSTPVQPVSDSVVVDTSIDIPAGINGQIQILARARNNLDQIGQAGPFTLNVTAGQAVDSIPPTVSFEQISPERMELQDVFRLELSGSDGNQGSGISSAGYTIVSTSPTRGETVVVSDVANFNPPRTGTLAQTFDVPVFNANPLSLPDSLVFEITAWLVDAQGNCSASVGTGGGESFECGTLGTGETVAADRTGLRVNRVIVDGTTVMLPQGGKIMDAAVDAPRQNLYLSNFDEDRIEVFDLAAQTFGQAVPVGSEPWGVVMDNGGNNLLVANSGGTNISSVDLTPAVPEEDVLGRILTPDVVFFDVELREDDDGANRYIVTFLPTTASPSFSDRPQFLAVDVANRILYSTRTTEIGDLGTIRRAIRQPGFEQPEVRVFFEHTAHTENEDFHGIANVDFVAASGAGDVIVITDHVLGQPGNLISSIPAIPSDAVLNLAAQGSDVDDIPARRWNLPGIGFSDTTFVAASGDREWVIFGEGATDPTGRVIMYESAQDGLSGAIPVTDIITNASEVVRGVGLNFDGTLGVARGDMAYFFTTDLRLQGVGDLPLGGSGAVLHPLHADAVSLANQDGSYIPDVHMAFLGTGEGTIDIIDTFHFFRSGRIFIRDVIVGPLKAVAPFPEDNQGLICTQQDVFDEDGVNIGLAMDLFANDNFSTPHPAQGGPTEDACVVLKLFGVTDAGGVVVVNVRKSDILRDHPSRQ